MFDALLLTQNDDRAIVAQRVQLDEARLPDGDVLVDIAWSTVNYKDALAITGRIPIVRQFPMVPGIDFAGTVLESHDSRHRAGDAVLLDGWGLGQAHWGGLARKARVKADWLVPMPGGMDARRAEAWGRLASELPAEITDANTRAITLDEVVDLAPRLLAGQVRGRVVVDVGAG
ncbi:alcohol dehydrogenase catalytic domain-containing protein [Bordetella bronchiseptica]|uniref:alcohol dehydrogenase catalytic domain-containing protein n=1 Tax=Bordetella bronchiseptica TaxID=518 RepID=UPI000460BC6C|nr:alcohol dehydrogenase catalytic domain-containing protein [Bordetella bronchiseptica]KDB83778.1 alcohol dehydrogenase, catalytic domain, GroES-like protein [Bordetella bronchiseptica CARE970018BB]KDC95066.1 alcohol dehydrogenase, catalytic domain, GroES-like protein [Bordetella bronchiseptica MBORD670]KDD21867.1 alcohol dehydrogenase, catalytic domain, GroES-like protein [Bordetella bronchiseptica MBORD785]KDD32463.1 alcohol dehydrogenase, catalytic domain, GroES-like protein [Bordetella bro